MTDVDWLENGELYVPRSLRHHCRPKPSVTITFTHGYEETPVDLVGVVGSLVKRATLAAVGGDLTTGPFRISGNNVSADFNTYEKAILERYRVVPFA